MKGFKVYNIYVVCFHGNKSRSYISNWYKVSRFLKHSVHVSFKGLPSNIRIARQILQREVRVCEVLAKQAKAE